uniref:Major facilitator superfamily (MFS) profile domain-containing protein n=1 Tax=Strigamia maritima TaxID=126957 RepID=T1ITN7_STRMM
MDVSKSEYQFCPESSFDSLYAAMGVMSHSGGKIGSNNNFCYHCQKETDDKHHECFGVDSFEPEEGKKKKWLKKQWMILVTSMLGNFGCAVCVSLQAPFFPAEAEKKGVTPTVYGFVFSAFSLTVFLLAPFLGKYIGKIGPRFMMNTGIFVTSTCCILFGWLDKIQSRTSFTTFAFLVRIVEATGDAAYHTANFSTMAATFPTDIGKTFAFLRAAFGLGLIVGPTIGGVLYQVGGYTLPFVFMGSILLFLSLFSTILFWNEPGDANSEKPESSIVKALCIPSVSLSMTGVCSGALSIGFLSATLEPHLRQFNLNAIQVGLVFVISGGFFAFTSVFWGWLCDGKVPPKIIISIGAFFISINYILIGPPPFMPFDSSLALVIIALTFHGFGLAAELLASHIDALKQSMLNGFEESYQTYGMISGPSIGGVLLDQIGFKEATIVLLGLQLILLTANLLYYFVFEYHKNKTQKSISDTEKTVLLTYESSHSSCFDTLLYSRILSTH